jgi:hypothetical protein
MARDITMNQLTEGIRERKVGAERNRLMEKWNRTGLLRGMDDYGRETMSQLLENQAAQLLREGNALGTSTGTAGNIDGFSNIAFPIVRRVFGGLVANDLVSIQPMSLPSGLLFYLDYTYGSDIHGDNAGDGNDADTSTANIYEKGASLYGNPSGASVRTGAGAVGGQYDLAGTGYSKVHRALATVAVASKSTTNINCVDANAWGAYSAAGTWTQGNSVELTHNKNLKLIGYDQQLIKEVSEYSSGFTVAFIELGTALPVDKTLAKSIALVEDGTPSGATLDSTIIPFSGTNDSSGDPWMDGTHIYNLRRLNEIGTWDGSNWTPGISGSHLKVVMRGASTTASADTKVQLFTVVYPVADSEGNGGVLTIPSFESDFGASPTPIIPEIDIKIESIAVTAQTRKLRARWSPELAQDLNAYHSLDAEVELTQILSEQIALEIDREILNDLLVEAKGANFFWSRAPGKFVNKRTGAAQNLASTLATGPQFTGTVREWYETLVETIIDVANEIHRKTLRGSANFIVCSPEVATVFEASVLYKPTIKIDGQGQTGPEFSIGAQSIGSLSNRFTVYKDPYFPRNKILVGYKGGSYLETGYVYAPYVPLIVTPTIFAPEDFTPRKGVMTRYGKKMVRADFYGTVTCLDMDII